MYEQTPQNAQNTGEMSANGANGTNAANGEAAGVTLGATHLSSQRSAIDQFPRTKARSLRFTAGAPRSAQVIGDGTRALFLRSESGTDTVTSLWLSVWTGSDHREVLLADPRTLMDGSEHEEVSAEELARRERAREGGQGIVSYSVDAAGKRVVFMVNGQIFLTEIADDAAESRTRVVGLGRADITPINPRISPDGELIAYTTGLEVRVIALGGSAEDDEDWAVIGIDEDECQYPDQSVGLAEFVAGEEMDRYEGFWWAPNSRALLVQTTDEENEPEWTISDPANPEVKGHTGRYARALTQNALVSLAYVGLDVYDDEAVANGDFADFLSGKSEYVDAEFVDELKQPKVQVNYVADIDWDHEAYEYLASVSWKRGTLPVLLVQNRLQQRDQVLAVRLDEAGLLGENVPVAIGKPIATTVLEEHTNNQWIDIVLGTPQYTPDGRLVCAYNDMEHDTNRLTLDGAPFTPQGWQVREVLDVTDHDVLAVVSRTPELDNTELPQAWSADSGWHDARSFDVVSFGFDGSITPLHASAGVHTVSRGTAGLVITSRTMNSPLATMTHICTSRKSGTAERAIARIVSHANTPGFTPNTVFVTLPGEHKLLAAITRPSASSKYANATKLPVLLKPYGGPGFQQVALSQAYYWDAQWWADQGFLVVTADGRGTPGRGPVWDRAIYENMKDVTLVDQVEAVHGLEEAVSTWNKALGAVVDSSVEHADGTSGTEKACACGGAGNCGNSGHGASEHGNGDQSESANEKANESANGGCCGGSCCGNGGCGGESHAELMYSANVTLPAPDLEHVAMIGWSYGGFLSALAVLDAPDVVQAACAGAPPTDWTLYDTHYTERYLGLDPAVYRRNSIIDDASKLRRPLMLIHGFADDNVTIAHSLRLSQALMTAGKPHTFLPLTGITHMTNDETVAENLLILQRDFLYDAFEIGE